MTVVRAEALAGYFFGGWDGGWGGGQESDENATETNAKKKKPLSRRAGPLTRTPGTRTLVENRILVCGGKSGKRSRFFLFLFSFCIFFSVFRSVRPTTTCATAGVYAAHDI